MIQAATKPVTFDEFVAWYPDNPEHRYELHNGVIVEMPLGSRKSQVKTALSLHLQALQVTHMKTR